MYRSLTQILTSPLVSPLHYACADKDSQLEIEGDEGESSVKSKSLSFDDTRPDIAQTQIDELHAGSRDRGNAEQIDVPVEVLPNFTVRLHNTARFKPIWNSHGTMSRSKVSIWGADLDMGFHKKNIYRVCLGHYANVGFNNPGKDRKNNGE